VRGKILDAGALRSSFHNMPYCLRGEPVATKFSHAIYRTENGIGAELGVSGPGVNRPLNPYRNWDRADVLSFADQIGNGAVFSPTSSARRNPHPSRTAKIAVSRLSRRPSGDEWRSRGLASSTLSQLPILTPNLFATFTRRMPATSRTFAVEGLGKG
jgi:hypothetical protein